MSSLTRQTLLLMSAIALSASAPSAQGRGGAEWTTSGGDAQRSSWIRTDAKITAENLQKPGYFKFLWKLKLANEPKQLNSLTQPVLLDRIIGFRGFKSVAFVGSSDETVYAIDTDFGSQLWRVHLNFGASFPPIVSGTLDCPGGLTAALTRPTPLSPAAPAAGGGGGGRGGRSGGGVGEPGKGATTLATAGQGRGGGAPQTLPTPPGGAPVPGSAAAVAAAARGGGGGGGGRGAATGAPDAAYVVGSDGFVRALNVQSGWELSPPVQFLPANANATGLLLVNDETSGYLYTSTTRGCGSTPDAVLAVDLISADKKVTSWSAGGATIAGPIALGRDGTIYVATADGTAPLSNSVVALEPKTLRQKAAFTQAKADFATAPLVFDNKGKDAIAVSGRDGKIYLLDSASMRTPLAVGSPAGQSVSGALASWQDAQGTRWILAPVAQRGASVGRGLQTPAQPAAQTPAGAVVAFKVADEGGALKLQQAWTSRDLTSPMTPMIVNGVVFALSSGEYRTTNASVSAAVRAQRSVPAVLYALDAATGKELWTSGRTMTSFARSGLSGGAGVVYIPTYDGTLYAFGVPIEK